MSSIPQHLRSALADRYSLERELGRGGMATVFLGQDLKHDRVVALKVLHPELAAALGPDRFLREIKLAARLNHPNILPLFDSGEASGWLYYVMPYVEGESLRQRLDREKKLSFAEAAQLVSAIGSALDYAHRQNIVHRDIKPENVMLHEGVPMVMDFGIAKAVSVAGGDTLLTQTGMMVGTPAYVSPEQAAGEREIDGRSDQYSLACMLFEMLSGNRPFTGPTAQAVLAKRFTESAPTLKSASVRVAEHVEKAVARALAKEPTERFDTVISFVQAIAPETRRGNGAGPTGGAELSKSTKSVAVLPFTNMSADAENEYFTDGIAEEIISALSKIQALHVASRTSSFAFKGKTEDIRDIGRKLEVGTVLEGSVRKSGNKLRISAQLISVADGYQLWSERYDRELEDVFAIQDDIAQNIAKALRLVLTDREREVIEKVPTTNLEAYDYYLRGRQYFSQLRLKSLKFARQMFNRAIEIDPDYALAHAGVAYCCAFLYMYFDARASNLNQADAASRKAVELDPQLAEAHVARGFAVSLRKEFEEAERELELAIELDPRSYDAAYFYGRALLTQGKWERAAELFARASEIRPEDYSAPGFLSQAYEGMKQHDKAIAARKQAIELAGKHLELNPDDSRALVLGAAALASIGEPDRAAEWAGRGLAIDPEDPMTLYNVACVYALSGRRDAALSCLEKAVDNGFGHKEWLEHDTDLETLRDDPRFQSLASAM
ncbi:MAG: protein kinase [Gemmatimonadaceae bacterium]|nr:protein kinase [Gemmatimonadaceae bacterium]